MADRAVSVFTTLYNHEKFIGQALRSALEQSLAAAEIIVLDDGSTDGSVQAAQAVTHPSIHIFDEKCNLGGANTVKGVGLCKGSYIAILNSDDAWEIDKLEKQFQIMSAAPNVGAVFTHVKTIDEYGAPLGSHSHTLQSSFNCKNRTRHEWLRHFFLRGNPFCASSAFVRRKCFDELGVLDGRYIQLQDMDMWIRIAIAGYDLHVIEEPLTCYRIMRNGSNLSTARVGPLATNLFEWAKILRHFWSVSSLEELTRIFPEIEVHDKADGSLTQFYLARYAARLPGLHHGLFALETMSRWGGDFQAMSLARKCHGFDFSDYRSFFATGPVRQLLNRSIRHQINRLAMSVMPRTAYQRARSRIDRFRRSRE